LVLRTHYDWKQLALAHEAGVKVKTIERIEAGERVSDETLVKVARALKLRDDAFTGAHYSPSDQEVAEMLRKAKETIRIRPCMTFPAFPILTAAPICRCVPFDRPAKREINGLPAAIRRFIGRKANFALISAQGPSKRYSVNGISFKCVYYPN
jgi:transcriptional regulator with XRE-family HTH domain